MIINTKILFLAPLLFFFPFLSVGATFSVQATDTIAGYSAPLKSSQGSPSESVIFLVEKPDGGIIRLEESADESGIARVDFLGFHTKKSGTYSVKAFADNDSEENAPRTLFRVFPDTVSSSASKTEVIKDAAPADGSSPGKIRVTLRDRHGNPVEGHRVDLISSRPGDTIEALQEGISDNFGEVFFHLFSREAGVASFSAFDRHVGFALDERAKILFFESEKKDIGGNSFSADLFGDSETSTNFGPVDHFLVEFPDRVEAGSDSNFLKISALDREGHVSKDYTGRILISTPDDENAILPGGGEYQFTDRDQGVRQFDLALIFSKAGQQSILVNDYDDGRVSVFLKGEKTVEVVGECFGENCNSSDPGSSPPTNENTRIIINTPANDTQFGSAQISLTGKGKPNTNVKIFLDGREFGEIEVDADGLFLEMLPHISDGEHELFVREVSLSEERSASVRFFVDTTPPTLDDFALYPSGSIAPGGTVSVTFFSESDLDSAVLRVAGLLESFQEDQAQPGKYEASFSAPQISGEYGITLVLTDSLKNSGTFGNVGTIQVSGSEGMMLAPQNIRGEAGDTSAFISWDPVADPRVRGYRIFAGTNELFLKPVFQGNSQKTTALLTGLENDKKLFFSVVALSDQEQEGLRSPLLFVIPQPGKELPAASEPPPVLTGDRVLQGSPLDGKIRLSWEAPQKPAAFFDIRLGISSQNYRERFFVSAEKTASIVPDLINGIPYFLTIVPVDSNGIPTGEKYTEVRVVPSFSGAHPAPVHKGVPGFDHITKTEDAGPNAFFLFGCISFVAGIMLSFQRPRMRKNTLSELR